MPGDRERRKYNEALVRREELDIDPSVLEDRGRELRRANGGKVGEPYSHHCPESFMGHLAFLYSGSSSTCPTGRPRGSCASSPGSWWRMGCRSRTTPR